MQKIHLIRHGHTAMNQQHRYCGSSNVPLSEKGQRQIELLGECLSSEKIASIYSSPSARAVATTAAIADHHNIRPREMDALKEIDFGSWERLTFKEIQSEYPHALNQWFRNAKSFTFPGGENISDFHARVLEGLDAILADKGDLAIVAHGGSLRVIICHLCGWGMDRLHSFELAPASISILNRYGDTTVAEILNERCHLQTKGET